VLWWARPNRAIRVKGAGQKVGWGVDAGCARKKESRDGVGEGKWAAWLDVGPNGFRYFQKPFLFLVLIQIKN
jgi:hypothetical protein